MTANMITVARVTPSVATTRSTEYRSRRHRPQLLQLLRPSQTGVGVLYAVAIVTASLRTTAALPTTSTTLPSKGLPSPEGASDVSDASSASELSNQLNGVSSEDELKAIVKEVGNGEQDTSQDSQFAVNPEDLQETSEPAASVDLQEVAVMDDPQNKSEQSKQTDTEKNNFYLFNQFQRDVMQDEKAGARLDEVSAMAVQQPKLASGADVNPSTMSSSSQIELPQTVNESKTMVADDKSVRRVERSPWTTGVEENQMDHDVPMTADNMAAVNSAGPVISASKTRNKRDLLYEPVLFEKSEADDYFDKSIEDDDDDGRWDLGERVGVDDDVKGEQGIGDVIDSDYELPNYQLKFQPTPNSYRSNENGSGSLVKYLGNLRTRKFQQQQQQRALLAARAKEKAIRALLRQQKLMEKLASYPAYVPAMYHGVDGFFVPSTNMRYQSHRRHRELRKPPPPRYGLEWAAGQQSSPRWGAVSVGLGRAVQNDDSIAPRRGSLTARNRARTLQADVMAGKWAQLVHNEVRQALDEYDEVYRQAAKLKAAAKLDKDDNNRKNKNGLSYKV